LVPGGVQGGGSSPDASRLPARPTKPPIAAATSAAMPRLPRAALALVALLATPVGAVEGQGVSGVQKVIQMLTDMQTKAKEEKNAEQVAFVKYETWCKNEVADMSGDIKKAGENIELMTAEIGKLGADAEELGQAIKKLQGNTESFQGDLKKEQEQRATDHAEFLVTEKDFSESVDALERALAVLQDQNSDRAGAAAALLQVSSSSRMPEEAKAIVSSFLGLLDKDDDAQSPLGGADYEAPEADAYESQTGGAIGLLKKLHDDFREKLGTAQKEEMNAAHASSMIVQDLADTIENAEKDVEEKTKVKEQKLGKKAETEKQLQSTTASKAADEETLSEVSSECEQKKLSFQEKQDLRTEEMEAIAKALEILSSDKVSGSAEKHLSFAQANSATSLLQGTASRAAMERAMGIRRRVRDFVSSESKRLKSKTLALLAEKMAADPFSKVKKMIDSMITRLMEEAKQDAEHEGFCDAEMGKSKITRNKLTEDIDALTAAIDDGKSTILELSESTSELQKELVSIEEATNEASSIRAEEKAKNKATIADAQAAQQAVSAATAVLKDFYTKALQATAFIQGAVSPGAKRLGLISGVKMGSDEWDALANPAFDGAVDKGHKEGMKTFGKVNTGQQDSANGVLGMLEVIMSEFSNLEADTSAAEVAAAKAYERFLAESSKSKAAKEKAVEMNDADRVSAESKLQQDTADVKTTQDELLSADRYYEKLVPQCVDQGQTWEERVAAQKAEIDSLKEALKLLSSPDVA